MKKIVLIVLAIIAISLLSCDIGMIPEVVREDIRTKGVLLFEYQGYDNYRPGAAMGIRYTITNTSGQKISLQQISFKITNTNGKVLEHNTYWLEGPSGPAYMLPNYSFTEWYDVGGINDFYKSHELVYYSVKLEDGTFVEYFK